ncbi:Ski complex subunit Rec14 [Coemansia sp. RSA 1813]|nr:Ski complex subunit Rec14 [Coemansia sp. RSA 1646]KAJ1768937.1 Ski complex subunit Rec14 [Coemansia sp. RSA 1843]KAJ2087681.1 Ski complex subunit Rec14 [Coemansia sp. RSA 986]KAJ2212612.1 Ski complex subunit Rec14 [Coemansia sp. RSA 487]KAJ2567047.1 Ski complex subunit Rec14 [Coemansia sp. RSA 1813]
MSSALYVPSASIEPAHEDDIWNSRWVPGRNILATAGSDEVVKIWDAQTGECIKSLKDGDYAITSLETNAQGTRALTSSMDGKIRVWDIEKLDKRTSKADRPIITIDAKSSTNAWKTCFVGKTPSSDSGTQNGESDSAVSQIGLIASSTDRGVIKLWSTNDGREVGELDTSRPSFLSSLAVSPDSTKIACGSASGDIYVFDAAAGSLHCTFSSHSGNIRSISFSEDSGLLVTSSDDKQIQVHDVRYGSPVATLLGHYGWVMSAEMHPNGKYIASGSVDAKVKIWDVAQRACVETHNQHSQAVLSVAWQHSSETLTISRPMLASAGEDCNVQLYDPLLA